MHKPHIQMDKRQQKQETKQETNQEKYVRVTKALAELRNQGKSRHQIYFLADLKEQRIIDENRGGNGLGDRHLLAQFTDITGLKKNGNPGKVYLIGTIEQHELFYDKNDSSDYDVNYNLDTCEYKFKLTSEARKWFAAEVARDYCGVKTANPNKIVAYLVLREYSSFEEWEEHDLQINKNKPISKRIRDGLHMQFVWCKNCDTKKKSELEVDHRIEDCEARVCDTELQQVNDFQLLCRQCNITKRGHHQRGQKQLMLTHDRQTEVTRQTPYEQIITHKGKELFQALDLLIGSNELNTMFIDLRRLIQNLGYWSDCDGHRKYRECGRDLHSPNVDALTFARRTLFLPLLPEDLSARWNTTVVAMYANRNYHMVDYEEKLFELLDTYLTTTLASFWNHYEVKRIVSNIIENAVHDLSIRECVNECMQDIIDSLAHAQADTPDTVVVVTPSTQAMSPMTDEEPTTPSSPVKALDAYFQTLDVQDDDNVSA